MDIHILTISWIVLFISLLGLYLFLSHRMCRHFSWPGLLAPLALISVFTAPLWLGLSVIAALMVGPGFSSHPFTSPELEALTAVMALFGLAKLPYDFIMQLGWSENSISAVLSLYLVFFLLGLLSIFLGRLWGRIRLSTR
jgi:hypothetical protein